ncbi:MAG: S-layer homology domain-containing protein [Clostridia bacterium]
MKKKILSMVSIFILTMSLFTGIQALAVRSNIEHFSQEVFSMDNDSMFMDMVETFHDLSVGAVDDFRLEYEAIIDALDLMHSAEITDDPDYVYDLVVEFVKDDTVTDQTISNMRTYLEEDKRDSFEQAFTARGIHLNDSDIDHDLITRGIERLDVIYGYLKANRSLRINIITKSTGGSYSDRGRLDDLMDAYFAIGGNDSQVARDAATAAFDSLIEYYNSLDSSTDKSTIDGYLYDLGLVYRATSTSSGGSTPPPVEEDDFDNAIEDQDTETAGDILEGDATEADTEEEVEEILDNTSVLIETTTDTLSEDITEAEEQLDKIAETINTVSNTLDVIEDSDKVEEKINTLLDSITTMTNNAKESGLDTTELEKSAENLAKKAVEKAGTTTATSTKEGTKATSDLSDLDLSEQIEKANTTAENMTTKLSENQLNITKQKVETKVTINVDTDEDVDEVDVTVPNLDDAFEKVDKVKVSSRVASFELEKDTIETSSDENYEERINLNAKKPTAEELEAIRSNLAPGQNIPEGAEVINLTASVKRVNRETGEVESTRSVTNFNQRIKVSVPYTLKEGEDPKEVSVFLVQEDGTVKKVGGVYNPTTKQMEFYRKTFSNYYVAASRITFDDTTELETMYKDAIEILAGKGLIAGKTPNLYDPDALVTRAEFTVLIARMLELEADPAGLPFSDVDNDNAWFRNHLAGAYNAGIINGTSATTFHPQNNITRQEAAAIVVNAARFLGYKDADGSVIATRYQDHAQIAPWAVRSVATVHRDRLAAGMYTGSFMPKENVTRDETAVFIYNMLFEY